MQRQQRVVLVLRFCRLEQDYLSFRRLESLFRRNQDFICRHQLAHYSTVTLLARFRGWSTSVPLRIAT